MVTTFFVHVNMSLSGKFFSDRKTKLIAKDSKPYKNKMGMNNYTYTSKHSFRTLSLSK